MDASGNDDVVVIVDGIVLDGLHDGLHDSEVWGHDGDDVVTVDLKRVPR